MRKIKEVIVFSEQGDPTNINTWSNVPYFLIKSLESNGVKVHGINLAPVDLLQKVVKKVWTLRYGKQSSFYSYTRSALYYQISRYKIKKALQKFSNADACLFTTFSLSASGLTKKPSILFCDWTIEHYFEYFLERKPEEKELASVARQNDLIEKADSVFVLFPAVAERMKKRYNNPNIYYKGNVINNLYEPLVENIEQKQKENSLVFIGSSKYMEGATALISAFSVLKKTIPDLTLDIVGIDTVAFQTLPAGVTCHGYLSKGIPEQAQKFYDLLSRAKVFINTTSKWGAFSASLEAMYFYTPVLVTPYEEFIKTFGEKIDFGAYFNPQSDDLTEAIRRIITAKEYKQMCYNAHNVAKAHTWEKYVSSMLSTIQGSRDTESKVDEKTVTLKQV